MTFLIVFVVIEICSFRLVLEGKTGKEIPESSRLEFLEKFLRNNFAPSVVCDNTWSQLNRGDIEQKGGVQCFVVVNGGDLSRLVNFFSMNCKNNLFICIWGHVQNINSLAVAVNDWPSCYPHFYIFLLPLASSGFHPIFTIDSMQKSEYKVKDKRFYVWSKESFPFLS